MTGARKERSLAASIPGGQRAHDLDELDLLPSGAVSVVPVGNQTFLYGSGASGDALSTELARLAASRVGIVCTASVARGTVVPRVSETVLRNATVEAILSEVGVGVSAREVERLAVQWMPLQLDTLIAIGGGSAIDTAKALALLLSGVGAELGRFFVRPGEIHTYPEVRFPNVIALPTTLSGAEVTASAGIIADDEKRLIRVEEIAPKIVCVDPLNLMETPPDVLITTGFCALAHGIETVYSRRRNPLSTALALRSASLLGRGLTAVGTENVVSPTAARHLGIGATLAALALKTCTSALQHVICQVLGGSFGVPHGVGHSVMLPAVLHYNEPNSRHEQQALAAALATGTGGSGTDLSSEVEELRRLTSAPASLKSTGLTRDQLKECALRVFEHPGVASNPRMVANADEIMTILEEAW